MRDVGSRALKVPVCFPEQRNSFASLSRQQVGLGDRLGAACDPHVLIFVPLCKHLHLLCGLPLLPPGGPCSTTRLQPKEAGLCVGRACSGMIILLILDTRLITMKEACRGKRLLFMVIVTLNLFILFFFLFFFF